MWVWVLELGKHLNIDVISRLRVQNNNQNKKEKRGDFLTTLYFFHKKSVTELDQLFSTLS